MSDHGQEKLDSAANQNSSNTLGRVHELEKTIETLRLERDDLARHVEEAIAQKNKSLDFMRLRASRLEFAQKEAIHFLGKPVAKMIDALASGSGGNSEHTDAAGKSSPSETNASNAEPNKIQVSSPFEREFVECVRFALQYLKNAQAAGIQRIPSIKGSTSGAPCLAMNSDDGIIPDGSGTVLNAIAHSPSSAEPPSDHNLASLLPSDSIPHNKVEAHGNENPPPRRVSNLNSRLGHMRSISLTAAAEFARNSIQQDAIGENEQDLTNIFALRSPVATTPSCTTCRSMGLQLGELKNELEENYKYMLELTSELENERSEKEQVNVAKNLLDQEIEELTAQLFDQANKLVVEEAKRRDELELENRGLTRKLNSRDEEFRQLKKTLALLESSLARSRITPNSQTNGPHTAIPVLHLANANSSSSCSLTLEPTHVDGIELAAFQNFLRKVMMPDARLETEVFIKKCITDDIEPCLYPPSAASFSSAAGSFLGSFRKRLLESLYTHHIDIKPIAECSSLAPSDSMKKCALCSFNRQCSVGLRFNKAIASSQPIDFSTSLTTSTSLRSIRALGGDYGQTWYPVDRYCIERIRSVLDFYAWISSLRHDRVENKPIIELFRTLLWYRRRMAEARIGSIALFRCSTEKDALVYTNVQITH